MSENPTPPSRTARYRVTGRDSTNLYYRLNAAGRSYMAERECPPDQVPVKHRVFVVAFRDGGRQHWVTVEGGVDAARAVRNDIAGRKANHERVAPPKASERPVFGAVADEWLQRQVAGLRPATQANYAGHVERYLRPRWGTRLLDEITLKDAAEFVSSLRAEGLAWWTIAGAVRVAGRVFKYAARGGWHGSNPFALLEEGERPKLSETRERRIYEGDELAQTLAAASEPWRTLFALAGVTGARESELLGLWWSDVDLRDPATATIRFTHQVDRQGQRVALKTEQSKATLPLPRATAAMLFEHKARSLHTGPRAYVFGTRDGAPLDQRNVLRALYRAQRHARTPEGAPTFPGLFEHDAHGHLVVDARGEYVPTRAPRKGLDVPDFHAIRHTAAMDCDDAEEARDLLRHKDSTVTRMIYRGHFDDRRREALRAKMEARSVATAPAPAESAPAGEVVPMRRTG